MKDIGRKIFVFGFLAIAWSVAAAQDVPAVMEQYCIKCHNFEDWAGSLDMEGLDFDHVEKNAETWEMMIRKTRVNMMPPAGEDRPGKEVMARFDKMIADQLDKQVKAVPAAPAVHRLNRTEYGNAIRDLLALDIDVSTLLPRDNSSEGFDNIAASLGFSPALVQAYTSAAMKISRQAVGDLTITESSHIYLPPPEFAQDKHIDGMPLGTRGGMKITHDFPLDAQYDINIGGRLFSFNGGAVRDLGAELDVTIDGHQVPTENNKVVQIPLTAGPHTITAAIIDNRQAAGVNDIYDNYSIQGNISRLEIVGPFNPVGPGDTPSREKIFSCYPATNDEETACAEVIVEDVATRAFRGPVSEAEVNSIMDFYQEGYREGGFESGIQQALSRILIDPNFLIRFEEEPEGLAPGEIYRISDLELASRLSFFLWSSIPDEELLTLAMDNELHNPDVLEQQINRMLADEKSRALVENFAGQWLFLRDVETVTPEMGNFNDNLREAFIKETQLSVSNIISEDNPVTDLLDADYTFLNERLAKHYGIDNVRGSYFRKVKLPEDSPRRGILGQASILTVTSTASRTSPVVRGSWVLQNLMNAPVPSPPPGVDTNIDGDGSTVLTSSVRDRLIAHHADPVCAACHAVIDPVGFALENFDLVGQWREYDGDSKVDPSGTLLDGSELNGPVDLRNALVGYSELFVETMTEKLMMYALGRELEYYDMPAVRSILRNAKENDFRFSYLVKGIINSEQFTKRITSGNDEVAGGKTEPAANNPEA